MWHAGKGKCVIKKDAKEKSKHSGYDINSSKCEKNAIDRISPSGGA